MKDFNLIIDFTFFDILKRRLKFQTVTLKIIYNTYLTFDSQIINENVFLKNPLKNPYKQGFYEGFIFAFH